MRSSLIAIALAVACARGSSPTKSTAPAAKPVTPPIAGDAAGERVASTPWLGVLFDRETAGARVLSVVGDGPAQRAGIAPGDDVVAIDGKPVTRYAQVTARVQRGRVGERVAMTVARDGRRVELQVELEARPDLVEMSRAQLVGRAAPTFALPVVANSGTAKLADLGGDVVLVAFFATWCGPCARTAPVLQDLHARYADRGLRVVAISVDEGDADLVGYARERGIAYPIAHDGDGAIARAYWQAALPTLVAIDRDGVVRNVEIGIPDAAELERSLVALLAAPRHARR
jgi:thiol-disulfide isomerase/thioredoxin